MWQLIRLLFDNFTRETLRLPELGFLGDVMPTEIHTPFFCGQLSKPVFLDFLTLLSGLCTKKSRQN